MYALEASLFQTVLARKDRQFPMIRNLLVKLRPFLCTDINQSHNKANIAICVGISTDLRRFVG